MNRKELASGGRRDNIVENKESLGQLGSGIGTSGDSKDEREELDPCETTVTRDPELTLFARRRSVLPLAMDISQSTGGDPEASVVGGRRL